uniref:Putative RNA-binding protein 15 n=1 Tax=Phallusia mammillata TaxID=59560 RepID=A0A6F9DR69_9ASCI|nr:putative RNA-binding protein 15 [Phallusia mammillata]
MKRQGDRDSPSRMKRPRGRSPNRRSYRDNSPDFRDTRYSRDARRNIIQNRHRSPVVSPRYSPPVESARSRRAIRDQDEYYTTLLVRNFSSQLARDDIEYSLFDEFRKFGEVSVKVERDYNGDRVAYATFRNPDDARECKNAKGHLVMHDRRLTIETVLENEGRREHISPNYRSPPARETLVHSPRGISPFGGRSPRRRSPKSNYRSRVSNRDRVPNREKVISKDKYSPTDRYPPSRDRSSSIERRDRYYKQRDSPRYARNRSFSRSPYRSPDRVNFEQPSTSSKHSPSVSPNRKDSANGEDDPDMSHGGGIQDPSFFSGSTFMDKPIPPEDDPFATRTLFIGNLEPDVTASDIRRTFEIYGKIDDVDVKRAARGLGSYCFVRFENLDQAYKAKISFNGKPVLKNVVRIGYGKVMLSSKIWVGGLGKWTSLKDLEREFDRFGSIRRIDYHRGDTNAAILFESIDAAQAACTQMRGFLMPGAETRLRMDFLDPEPGMPGYDSYLEWGRHDVKGHDLNDTRDRHKGSDYQNKSRYRGRNVFEGDRKYKSDRRSDKRSPSPRDYRSPRSRDNKYNSTSKSRDDKSKTAALPDTAMTEMQFKHFHAKSCYTLHDLCQCFDPPCWQGGFVLKKVAFPVLFFLLDGDMGVFNRTTADPNSPTGRQTMFYLTQRLKLNEERVAEVSRRMKSVDASQTCIIVAVPGVPENLNVSGTLSGPTPTQHKPLRGLVKYFKEKEAAGIISVPLITLETPKDSEKLQSKDKEVSGMLHAFPPGAFSTAQLLKIGPSLQPQFFADDYMVIVLIKGSRSQLV